MKSASTKPYSGLKWRDGLSVRGAIQAIVAKKFVSGTEGTLRRSYQRAKSNFAPIMAMFDRIALAIGNDRCVSCLENAMSGDNKESIWSPP
jgi:hypothetical protein